MSTMSGSNHGAEHAPHTATSPKPPANTGLVFQDSTSVDEALRLSLRHYGRVGVRGRWFINSHPKSGTHLLRNILFHFNTPEIHRAILFYDSVAPALDTRGANQIYMGHVPYATFGKYRSHPIRAVLLLRHPCSIALALARAFYDRNSTRPDHLYMREHDSFDAIVTKVVTGYECQGQRFGSLASSLADFCLEWLSGTEFVLRFENIEGSLRSSDHDLVCYFRPVLEALFESVPGDAARRLRAGGSATISATYSRTASSAYDALQPEEVYALVDTASADKLRQITAALGYQVAS